MAEPSPPVIRNHSWSERGESANRRATSPLFEARPMQKQKRMQGILDVSRENVHVDPVRTAWGASAMPEKASQGLAVEVLPPAISPVDAPSPGPPTPPPAPLFYKRETRMKPYELSGIVSVPIPRSSPAPSPGPGGEEEEILPPGWAAEQLQGDNEAAASTRHAGRLRRAAFRHSPASCSEEPAVVSTTQDPAQAERLRRGPGFRLSPGARHPAATASEQEERLRRAAFRMSPGKMAWGEPEEVVVETDPPLPTAASLTLGGASPANKMASTTSSLDSSAWAAEPAMSERRTFTLPLPPSHRDPPAPQAASAAAPREERRAAEEAEARAAAAAQAASLRGQEEARRAKEARWEEALQREEMARAKEARLEELRRAAEATRAGADAAGQRAAEEAEQRRRDEAARAAAAAMVAEASRLSAAQHAQWELEAAEAKAAGGGARTRKQDLRVQVGDSEGGAKPPVAAAPAAAAETGTGADGPDPASPRESGRTLGGRPAIVAAVTRTKKGAMGGTTVYAMRLPGGAQLSAKPRSRRSRTFLVRAEVGGAVAWEGKLKSNRLGTAFVLCEDSAPGAGLPVPPRGSGLAPVLPARGGGAGDEQALAEGGDGPASPRDAKGGRVVFEAKYRSSEKGKGPRNLACRMWGSSGCAPELATERAAYDPAKKAYVMDFGGAHYKSSVKNMKLVNAPFDLKVAGVPREAAAPAVFQMGKRGGKEYEVLLGENLSAVHAFALAVSNMEGANYFVS